ncbi:MAG TPA: hypothetical protein VD993_14430 [Chitinophagaceae bacterium]|nr:hypothetical protein [Chitinophagaceae bacterium]
MWKFVRSVYRSFPVQLVILHLKKFQVLLLFWFLLFSTVNGSFMQTFGANSLFLAPEYLGKVNFISAAIVGVALGVFIMSWNITTFILFSRHFKFLATTTNPFLKYCINNSIIPLAFVLFYFFKGVRFAANKELMGTGEITLLALGFVLGLVSLILLSLLYFFRADKSIIRRMTPLINNPQRYKTQFSHKGSKLNESRLIKVEYYLNALTHVKKVRDVSHYSSEFIETMFSRHHFAAVLSIFIAFVFLILLGFFLDNPLFQLPAAASIVIFFAVFIAVAGAFSYFLQSWSIPFVILIFLIVNTLYRNNIIDPTNKAYGINYANSNERPKYARETLLQLCTNDRIEQDKQNMLRILDNWKKRQGEEKPVMVIINTSGGGTRSATFTMNALQRLDSLSGGELMRKTFLITGSSGGMLGASYFRELYRHKVKGEAINLHNKQYIDDIAGDLLNPLFSSLVARDLASPAHTFQIGNRTFVKDRGYAFEEKFNDNTRGVLNHQLKDYVEDEANAVIPLMLFHPVITRDGRKLIISSQPVSFLMKPVTDTATHIDPDAIDYAALFHKQDPMDVRMLTVLRMNATFPYVLPNVWLPSDPVIDVMDSGFRDNFGQETSARFLHVFRDWIQANTSALIVIQIRDRKTGAWEHPYESGNINDVFTKPAFLLQYNWYKIQEFQQNDIMSLTSAMFGKQFHKISIQYYPRKDEARASLNFHLTQSEKLDLAEALDNPYNQKPFGEFRSLIEPVEAKKLTKAE